LSFLAQNPNQRQDGAAAIPLDVRSARAEAALELGLLLASDQKRQAEARNYFDIAITDLSNLSQAFPRVAAYRTLLSSAKSSRDAAAGPKP
jgi:hypothetical protein